MKKQITKLLLLIIGMTISSNVWARDNHIEVDGIYYYVLSEEDCTVEVDGCDEIINGELSIPPEIVYNNKKYAVTKIGDSAFYYRSKDLISIEIPNSVTSIAANAFYKCSSLSSVKIGNGVTYIGTSAFHYCESLASVEIPNEVTTIGVDAFGSCTSLTSVEIPSSVTTIRDGAFAGCSNMTSINVDAANANYASVNGVLYNKDMTTLVQCPSGGESNVNIPNSVTTIGNLAFYRCESLASVEIPNGVTVIGERAFEGCISLVSVKIPNGVTMIGRNAFSGCESLTSVKIPSSVTIVEEMVCANCSSLTSVVIPNGVTTIGDNAFQSCSSLTSVEIPNSVTSIGRYAFYKCRSLTSVRIGNCVVTIGDYAFDQCRSLTSVEIPNSVISIGNNAFSWCDLTSVKIPNSVTTIGDYAFSYNTLKSVEIGNSVAKIGDYAFANGYITSIYCASVTPPTIIDYTFSIPSIRENCTLYVPIGCKSAYDDAPIWKQFLNIVEYDFPFIYVDKIELSKSAIKGDSGSTVQMSAAVYPWGATYPSVIWSSDNEAVATVTETGLVTLVDAGTATITATSSDDNRVSASCVVTVKEPLGIEPITSIATCVKVRIENGEIVISGINDDAIVEVYILSGQKVYVGFGRRIALSKGLYIIKVNDQVFKVVI